MELNADYLYLAVLVGLSALIARPMVNLNIWIYRKMGFPRAADFWQRQLPWWVPFLKTICLTGAGVLVLVGLGLI